MEFEFTQEQRVLRETIRSFAEEQILPHVREWDAQAHFPKETLLELGKMGILGIIFPEAYGGAAMSYVDYVIIVEELSRVDPSIGIAVAAHNSLCCNHIYMQGTEEQKKKYLAPLASGHKIGAWALTEPGSGSDAVGMRTSARPQKGGWVLNGTKTFITHATVGDVAVVTALTEPKDPHHGITAFIVEKGTPGFSPGKKEDKLGLRASDTGELVFEDCFLPDENRLGKVNEGFKDALKVLDGGRISIAALSLGGAQGAYETALKYSQQREAFGQKIATFQAIQFTLADMATRIEAARLLTFQAAWRKDHGLPVTKQSAMAKYYASEVSVWAAERAVQVLGGYGYIKDYPAEKFYRDTKLNTIGEGTSEIQRLVIARQIFREFGA
ncbi:MAG: acyl-CoA dehydrogenase family protein [Acidobacteria bacterium]|nr:acyl-CoA dehydrogenase family protein [Acidobacteriota bacterium]